MTAIDTSLPPASLGRLAELLAEVEALTSRLAVVTSELRTIVVPTVPSPDPNARYLTPEFTQQLLEHMHAAKRAALLDAKRRAPHAS
jgi:hypothetical protein